MTVIRLHEKRYKQNLFSFQFPETNGPWKGHREKLVSNLRLICYSLPSVTFTLKVIQFIKTEKLLESNLSLCFNIVLKINTNK